MSSVVIGKPKPSNVRVVPIEVHDILNLAIENGGFSQYAASILMKCLNVKTIRRLLMHSENTLINLSDLNAGERQRIFDRFQFEFDDIELTWDTKYCRILTIDMQELMECHLTECGIDFRTAEGLEKELSIHTLNDLLNLKDGWNRIRLVPNLGDKSIKAIIKALETSGFYFDTDYVNEQDTAEYKKKQLELNNPLVLQSSSLS